MDTVRILAPGYDHIQKWGAIEHVNFQSFPDGEISIAIPGNIWNKDVTLIGGCHNAQASETLLAIAYEVARKSPASLTVVITYFRNARSERSTHGEAVMAKFQANLWSGLAQVFPGVRLEFLDLHSDLILNYFHGPIHTVNISRPIYENLIVKAREYTKGGIALATVDEGHSSMVRTMAHSYSYGFAGITKQRLSGSDTRVLDVHGDVQGRTVIICDDIVATGSSLANAAKAYKDRGALQVVACATHGVFAGDAIRRLQESPIDHMFVTDSHPNALVGAQDAPTFVHIVPIRDLV